MSQTKVEAPFVENSRHFRNFIINGDMEIWQRATAATAVSDGSYSACDRWHFPFYGTDGAMTTERETLSDADQATTGMYYCNLLTCTTADTSVAANSIVQMRQTIEAQFCQPFKYGTSAAKTLTLSFYAKANASKTYGVSIWKRDSTAYYWFQDIAVTTSWKKFEIVISPTAGSTSLITASGGDIVNDNGEGIEVSFVLASGSNYQATADTWTANQDFNTSSLDNFLSSTDNTFRVTGVQLEIGDAATEFEHLPHDVQLQRCQRYYQRWQADQTYDQMGEGAAWSDTAFIWSYRLCPRMRAQPTAAATGNFAGAMVGNDRALSSIAINRTTVDVCQFTSAISDNNEQGTPGFCRDNNDGDAFIEFKAEL
tara:strand:+ start:57 stop:1163 length:1107 start_codon:yes stop_codon:yes gene_type:complete